MKMLVTLSRQKKFFAVNSEFTNAWKVFLYETISKTVDIEDDYQSNNGSFG